MAPPSQHQALRRAAPADRRENRRSWLSHGVAALAISALGLAAAGSLALTSNAENTSSPPPRTTVRLAPALPASNPEVVPEDPTATDPALTAFARRGQTTAPTPTRSAGLRTAIVKEKAAQRSEDLAKTAEAVTRTSRTESSDARQQALTAAEQARQVASAQIAAENLRRATAARLEAVAERRRAEQRQALLEAQQQAARQQVARQQAARQQAARQQAAQADEQATPIEPVQPDPVDPVPAQSESPVESPSTTRSPVRSTSSIPTGGTAVSPVPGAIIGSHFGQYGIWSRYHTGLDFRAAYGTPIRAVKAGTVLYAGNSGDWAGNHVAIRHADGKTTMSSHMSSMAVRSGETVGAGQVIGYVGQTGRAFGAHLHFELYPVGVRYGDVYSAINPQPWLTAAGVRTR